MATAIEAGSSQALALQTALQSKLVEYEFSSGDDSGVADYILSMVTRGMAQQDIQSEIAETIGIDDPRTADLTQYLFEQIHLLGGHNTASHDDTQRSGAQSSDETVAAQNGTYVRDQTTPQDQEAEMEDVAAGEVKTSIPTGPKSMRNGANGGNKRILGHLSRAMDRTNEHSIHRIKGTAGTGRINTHHREPPKGPTPKGPRNQQAPMQQNMMASMLQNSPFMNTTPEQQMQLMALYEGQAQMMANILNPQQQQQMFAMQGNFNPAMQNSNPNSGKSLFERVDSGPRRQNGNSRARQQQNGNHNSNEAGTGRDNDTEMNLTSSMEVEAGQADPATSLCRYNNFCTRSDCLYAHQSPAAPPNTAVDMTDECSFGAACMNRKCVGKHPSPAKRMQHKSEQQCKFFPNCTNPVCPFIHPNAPPCRNGADCTVPGCKFVHSKVACKFNPCLNAGCPYKHAEGQKRGKFSDRVWVNPEGGDVIENGADETKHLSERKFINENEEEELILPKKEQSLEDANIAGGGDHPGPAPQTDGLVT